MGVSFWMPEERGSLGFGSVFNGTVWASFHWFLIANNLIVQGFGIFSELFTLGRNIGIHFRPLSTVFFNQTRRLIARKVRWWFCCGFLWGKMPWAKTLEGNLSKKTNVGFAHQRVFPVDKQRSVVWRFRLTWSSAIDILGGLEQENSKHKLPWTKYLSRCNKQLSGKRGSSVQQSKGGNQIAREDWNGVFEN